MLFLKVPRNKAEKIRRELDGAGLLSKEYAIISKGDFVFLPILQLAAKKYKNFDMIELEAKKRPIRCDRIKDALSGFLTPNELESSVASFDILGTIAIIEIPEVLESKEAKIGEAILDVHRNVKSVFKKLGPMEGEYRVRKLQLIAGEDNTETIYRESGIKIKLDVSKVYFSVRLAHERKRIVELVKDGERVLVLFAGVGPFALIIAKQKAKPNVSVVAVEINSDAVRYMRENTALNKIKNVEAIEGDARSFSGVGFDRVVMPLPKDAHHFLDVAYRAVKDGGIVHFYAFTNSRDPFAEAIKKAKDVALSCKVTVEPVSMRIVRPFSPATVQVVLDLRISK